MRSVYEIIHVMCMCVQLFFLNLIIIPSSQNILEVKQKLKLFLVVITMISPSIKESIPGHCPQQPHQKCQLISNHSKCILTELCSENMSHKFLKHVIHLAPNKNGRIFFEILSALKNSLL